MLTSPLSNKRLARAILKPPHRPCLAHGTQDPVTSQVTPPWIEMAGGKGTTLPWREPAWLRRSLLLLLDRERSPQFLHCIAKPSGIESVDLASSATSSLSVPLMLYTHGLLNCTAVNG